MLGVYVANKVTCGLAGFAMPFCQYTAIGALIEVLKSYLCGWGRVLVLIGFVMLRMQVCFHTCKMVPCCAAVWSTVSWKPASGAAFAVVNDVVQKVLPDD